MMLLFAISARALRAQELAAPPKTWISIFCEHLPDVEALTHPKRDENNGIIAAPGTSVYVGRNPGIPGTYFVSLRPARFFMSRGELHEFRARIDDSPTRFVRVAGTVTPTLFDASATDSRDNFNIKVENPADLLSRGWMTLVPGQTVELRCHPTPTPDERVDFSREAPGWIFPQPRPRPRGGAGG